MKITARDYEEVAMNTLSNNFSSSHAAVEFTTSVFSLADDFSELEGDIADHKLSNRGLSPNGLADLETRFQALAGRFAEIQRVVSDPHTHLSIFVHDELGDDEATLLRGAIHDNGDLDRILTQVRDAQSRLSSELAAKRSHLTTNRSLFISLVSAGVATLALVATVAANTTWA